MQILETSWTSGGHRYTIATEPLPGETPADQRQRHADAVAADQVIHPRN